LRVLLISDIHGNLEALRAVLEHAKGWDPVWVLGDLVDYGPDPHEVIDVVRELAPDIIVRGNHDNAAAFGTDCFCDPKIHRLSVCTRENITLRLVSREQIRWLQGLPLRSRLEIGGLRYYIVHGSPISPLFGYIRPDMDQESLLRELSLPGTRLGEKRGRPVDADVIVVGHSHIPFQIRIGDVSIVNPGSVGQPRDGDARASYAILDLDKHKVEYYRVKYDVDKVLSKLKDLRVEEWCYNWLRGILLNGKVVEYKV
jgi:predicted phosphodiesterase